MRRKRRASLYGLTSKPVVDDGRDLFAWEGGMTERTTIESVIRSTYAARTKGDLDGTMANFADDAVFEFNGRGAGLPGLGGQILTKSAIRPVITSPVSGKSAEFDVFDLVTIRDGKIVAFHQSADTAMEMSLVSA